MELWRTIKSYPNYEVSSDGRVRNRKTGRVLKPGINTNGYPVVVLSNEEKKHQTKTVHRLVASTFYDCLDADSKVIDHIDGNKQNNHISNLEFCTSGENNRRAYATGLRKPSKPYNHPRSQPVKIVETGEIFRSTCECARAIGANRRHISDCLHGRLNTHHGYHYVYANQHGDFDE